MSQSQFSDKSLLKGPEYSVSENNNNNNNNIYENGNQQEQHNASKLSDTNRLISSSLLSIDSSLHSAFLLFILFLIFIVDMVNLIYVAPYVEETTDVRVLRRCVFCYCQEIGNQNLCQSFTDNPRLPTTAFVFSLLLFLFSLPLSTIHVFFLKFYYAYNPATSSELTNKIHLFIVRFISNIPMLGSAKWPSLLFHLIHYVHLFVVGLFSIISMILFAVFYNQLMGNLLSWEAYAQSSQLHWKTLRYDYGDRNVDFIVRGLWSLKSLLFVTCLFRSIFFFILLLGYIYMVISLLTVAFERLRKCRLGSEGEKISLLAASSITTMASDGSESNNAGHDASISDNTKAASPSSSAPCPSISSILQKVAIWFYFISLFLLVMSQFLLDFIYYMFSAVNLGKEPCNGVTKTGYSWSVMHFNQYCYTFQMSTNGMKQISDNSLFIISFLILILWASWFIVKILQVIYSSDHHLLSKTLFSKIQISKNHLSANFIVGSLFYRFTVIFLILVLGLAQVGLMETIRAQYLMATLQSGDIGLYMSISSIVDIGRTFTVLKAILYIMLIGILILPVIYYVVVGICIQKKWKSGHFMQHIFNFFNKVY